MDQATSLPRKTRELHNHHMDSTVWNDFQFRDGDVVVTSTGKSGTTWTQQIVAQLIFQGDPDAAVSSLSPWVDLRVPPKPIKLQLLEAQSHRRVLKTHLPLDALVFSPKAKYIYVGRDGRDTLWSIYNHHSTANALWYQAMNETPGLVGPPIGPPDPDIHRYFRTWLENDCFPWWSFWENAASWWAARDLPNVMFLHFNELKADLPGQIRRIAEFLDIEIDPARFDQIVEHCGFDYMKAHANQVAPLNGMIFEGGGESFIHKGVNGRWRDVLTAKDNADYEAMALEKLGPDCARWLATGEMPG